jgi:hypothetical protein
MQAEGPSRLGSMQQLFSFSSQFPLLGAIRWRGRTRPGKIGQQLSVTEVKWDEV